MANSHKQQISSTCAQMFIFYFWFCFLLFSCSRSNTRAQKTFLQKIEFGGGNHFKESRVNLLCFSKIIIIKKKKQNKMKRRREINISFLVLLLFHLKISIGNDRVAALKVFLGFCCFSVCVRIRICVFHFVHRIVVFVQSVMVLVAGVTFVHEDIRRAGVIVKFFRFTVEKE